MSPGPLGIFLAAFVAALPAAAWGNSCAYNGKPYDDRYPRPENFSGDYTCKTTTGKIVLREQYVNGLKDGPAIKYISASGEIDETHEYRRGKLHGVLRRYKNGKPYVEFAYVDGKQAGVQKRLEDGVVRRVYFVDDKGRVEGDMSFNKQGQLTTIKCSKRPIGKQDAGWCGLDGKQSTVTLYTEDGKLRATEQYLWGLAHGAFKKFNVAGTVAQEQQYAKGQPLQGGQREYDRQGKLLVKTDCDDKRSSCTETEFFEDGRQTGKQTGKQTRMVIVWKNGKTQQRTDYYQNGKPQETLVADGDRFVITEYFDTGVIASKGTFILGDGWYWSRYVPDGVIETFDEAGKLERRRSYSKGRRQGRSEAFWERDGRRFREQSEYTDDRLVRRKLYLGDQLGEESEFHPDGSIKSHREHKPGKAPSI